MATWILFFQLLIPIQPAAAPVEQGQAGATQEAAIQSELRHRGVERLFAKFNREAKPSRR